MGACQENKTKVVPPFFVWRNSPLKTMPYPILLGEMSRIVLARLAAKQKAHASVGLCFYSLAEEEGFEPPEPCGSTVFKTAALDRSATPLLIHIPQTVILGVQMYRFLPFCQILDSTFSLRSWNRQNWLGNYTFVITTRRVTKRSRP